MKPGAVHVALMALESAGAVTRVGHGPDALYAFNSQRSKSQSEPCPEGELILFLCCSAMIARVFKQRWPCAYLSLVPA